MTTTVVTGAAAATGALARLRLTSWSLLTVGPGFDRSAAKARSARYRWGCHGVAAAQLAQLVFMLAQRHMTNFVVASVERQLGSLLVEVQLQGCYPRGDVPLGELQLTAPVIGLRTALQLPIPL